MKKLLASLRAGGAKLGFGLGNSPTAIFCARSTIVVLRMVDFRRFGNRLTIKSRLKVFGICSMDCETWFQARLGGISRSAIFCARSVATAHPLFDRLTLAKRQTPPRKTATNNMSPLSRYIDPRPLEESSLYFQLLSAMGCKAMKFEPNLMTEGVVSAESLITRALHSTAAVEPPPRGREQLTRASWDRFVWVEVRPVRCARPVQDHVC